MKFLLLLVRISCMSCCTHFFVRVVPALEIAALSTFLFREPHAIKFSCQLLTACSVFRSFLLCHFSPEPGEMSTLLSAIASTHEQFHWCFCYDTHVHNFTFFFCRQHFALRRFVFERSRLFSKFKKAVNC